MQELELLDWRRRIGDLYGHARNADPGPAAWRRWRTGRDSLLRSHPQSPIPPDRREAFTALPFFDHDPAMRLVVDLEPVDGEVVGDLVPMRPIGVVDVFDATLTVFWLEGYAGGLFLPFGDATNGQFSYGGGRYLLDTAKGADLGAVDGQLVLDFNYAFHPSCAYDPAWTCPLAPAENRLPVEVAAGERLPSGG